MLEFHCLETVFIWKLANFSKRNVLIFLIFLICLIRKLHIIKFLWKFWKIWWTFGKKKKLRFCNLTREILKGDAFFKSEKRLTLVIWSWFWRSQLYRYNKRCKKLSYKISIHALTLIHFLCFMELLGYVHIWKSLKNFLMEIWKTS